MMVDSGATREFISEEFVRENKLDSYLLPRAIRIRLADGSTSLSKYAVKLKFYIGQSLIEREFVLTRLKGEYQAILGYSFLKDINPRIDWTNGTIRIGSESIASAIVQKRTPDVKIISAKQMARIMRKSMKLEARERTNTNTNNNNINNCTKFYISALKEICPFPLDSLT